VVHVAPSRRLRRRQAEDGWVDATGCVGPCYLYFVVFFLLDYRGVVVIYPFAWGYIYDPRGLGLLATSQFYFLVSRVEVKYVKI
jgi:hypothetical protein